MKAGLPINQDDILAYFVWIPRFKYTIPTSNKTELINIIFENKNTKKSNGTAKNDDYYTHPAFTFGNTELNGLWIGKFETTLDPNEPCSVNDTSQACLNVDNPTILPNRRALHNQSIKSQFETARKFDNRYGITSDAHVAKNSEWAAAAYLAYSKYGYNKKIVPGRTDITGYGTNTGEVYGTLTSYPQTTTNNITGVFGMRGGDGDRTMAMYTKDSNDILFGFTSENMPDKKYYDIYYGINYEMTYDPSCLNNKCKGHGIDEIAQWDDVIKTLPDTSYGYPCFNRGGDRPGLGALSYSVLDMNWSPCYYDQFDSFHVIIAPEA